MSTKKSTEMLGFVVLAGYLVYGFMRIPGVQYLVSLAAGGIVYGLTESVEWAIVGILATSVIFSVVAYNRLISVARSEGFMSSNPTEIAKRIQQLHHGGGVKGVLAAGAEGFEDAGSTDMTLSNPEKPQKQEETGGAVSSPAPAAASGLAGIDPEMAKQAKAVLESLTAQMNEAAPKEKQGFQAPVKNTEAPAADTPGLFKLGALPSDAAGGYHIDAGTTVVNALKALKPDQIKAMTQDTQKLIETQKSLMDMLRTFKPMLSEGKEMMETFSQMFSPTTAAAST
jgi:hypothetical protein